MSIRHLPRTVWLLGAISLLNDAASELVYPLLPLYLATVLVAGPSVLGLIEGAAEAASSLLKLASGMLYDRHGRAKPFIVAGYSIAAIARPLIALVAVWPVLLLVRVGDRIGKGLRSSPRDALLARSVDGGTLRPMARGWALYALVFVGFGLATSMPMFWLLAIGVGLYQALTEGAERALIADQVPAAQLGTAYGSYYLVKGLLLLPASALFGVLWQYGAAALAFGLAAACALAALGLLLLWVRPVLAVAERGRAA